VLGLIQPPLGKPMLIQPRGSSYLGKLAIRSSGKTPGKTAGRDADGMAIGEQDIAVPVFAMSDAYSTAKTVEHAQAVVDEGCFRRFADLRDSIVCAQEPAVGQTVEASQPAPSVRTVSRSRPMQPCW
jgi:hypothetical protein